MALKITQLAQITITTAGTRQQITSTDRRSSSILISAPSTNTGSIYVGDSSVSATTFVAELAAGATLRIDGPVTRNMQEEFSLSDIYVDTATNSNKVNVGYLASR